MIIFLISCIMHKTSLSGIIDNAVNDSCTIELNTGEMIEIKSPVCAKAKEGEVVHFYGRIK